MKKIALFLISCAYLASPTHADETATHLSSTSQTEQVLNWSQYTNTQKNYGIDYPAQWEKKEIPSLDLVVFSPIKDEKNPVHGSMNTIAEKMEEPISLDQFFSESITNLSEELQEFNKENEGKWELDGQPAKWIEYSHVMEGMQFRVIQYFMISNDMVYLLTFSAPEADFARDRPIFNQIAHTFHFLNTTTPTAETVAEPAK